MFYKDKVVKKVPVAPPQKGPPPPLLSFPSKSGHGHLPAADVFVLEPTNNPPFSEPTPALTTPGHASLLS